MEIKNVLVVDPLKGEFVGDVQYEEGLIKRILPKSSTSYEKILMPGFIDPHTHGCRGIDTMHIDDEKLEKWEHFLYGQGVTSFIPTTVSAREEEMIRVSNMIEEYMYKNSKTSVAGIHYEGPYINVNKKGAQNPDVIREASTREIEEILSPKVKLITMAPEINGFYDVLPALKENGTVVSIGHSDANFEDMKRAFLNGINRITHFPNAIRGLHHRELGGLGAGLYFDFSLEMIVDGVHLSPEFVNLIYRLKGAEKISLITDSISAAALEDGEYELGGLKVNVTNGKVTLSDGTLAGSTLLFNDAVKNFKNFTHCSLRELAMVSSYNTAVALNLEKVGRIEEGYKANFVLLDRELNVVETYLYGERVYQI
ncbi:N-acetylglucosamine-6-phosphate deacetylase [Mesoaciditoga lauensis]|uniref:N-acetylglucosamine-6-phosphate deacetylase n=1 Tax=Mesoaciditoga lauensis TaxID=1495039 RepID=UPI00055A0B1F|nr:N-acetylglucosamine-6-phosphate deacetylase [Mesoaciditoga lauensis]